MMVGIVLFGLLGAGLLAVAMLVRNEFVYRFRMELIKKIVTSAKRDIACGDYDWERRYDAFDAVSYDTMVWQFWKPLRAFYPDMSFCERIAALDQE